MNRKTFLASLFVLPAAIAGVNVKNLRERALVLAGQSIMTEPLLEGPKPAKGS